MNPMYPIFTEKAECQDCYKCVRGCSVKAIKIENGHATVVEEMCTLCGQCVNICPAGAKKFRDDKGRAKQLLLRKEKVIVSLAPSYASEFKGMDYRVIITALKKLGFFAVSETAYGAEEVSAHAADLIVKNKNSLFISSACPTAVKLIEKYQTKYRKNITPLISPVLAHCKLLRKEFGDDIGIVFVSPCISKKDEADKNPEILDIALTFKELKDWLNEEGVDLDKLVLDSDVQFVPKKIKEGSLYPIDGGMIAGIKANIREQEDDPFYLTISGMEQIVKTLKDIELITDKKTVFLEIMACEGGCINGPMSKENEATGYKRYTVIENADYNNEKKNRKLKVSLQVDQKEEDLLTEVYSENELKKALRSLGKFTDKDELNCGGCGYDSCRELAKAYLFKRAEKTMCVSYMRKLAQKKANLLINTMPSGVIIVDKDLKIVECNRNFARLMGKDILEIFDTVGFLDNANLRKIIPFSNLFEQVLINAKDVIDKEVKMDKTILQMSIFTIEKHNLIGAIIQDITDPAIQKQRVISKAQVVIQKNLETVQKIAYLLGENAADSEVILNSIIDTVQKR